MMQDEDDSRKRRNEEPKEATVSEFSGPKRLRGKQITAPKFTLTEIGDLSPVIVARTYLEHGWYLVPVDRQTGQLVDGEDTEPTRDMDKVQHWIERKSLAVGVATGQTSRVVALVCNGELGLQALEALLADQDPFATLEGREKATRFFLFRAPPEDLPSQEEIAPGVDFAGDDGYLVPLQSSWGTQNTEISPLPDWIRSLATGTTIFGFDDLVAASGLTALAHATTAFQAAKAYKGLGWKLFPVDLEGKELPTPEERCVPKLWEGRADIGLGLKTGATSGIVGLWCMDDLHKGYLEAKFGSLPLPQIKGDGIVHCFRAPQESYPSKYLFNGIEYFGEDSYLFAPPSIIKGAKLNWQVGGEGTPELPDIPQWLHDILSGRKNPMDFVQPQQHAVQKSQKWAAKQKAQKPGLSGHAGQFGVAAMAYARDWKWLVFPLTPGTKFPLKDSEGFKDATRDQDKIARWWGKSQRNVAVRTGVESGVVVLDVDVKKDQPGLESLHDLERLHGKMETLRASTPSGGIHLFFRAPRQGVGCRIGFLPGLDFKGHGGFVVVAPSRVGGGEYRWENPTAKIAEMPDWLFTMVKKAPKDNKGASETPMERVTYSTALCGVQEGARNDTIFRFAYKLRQEEWEYSEALVLVKTAAGNCQPPLDEDEAIRCLESAWKYAPPAALSDLGNAKRFVALFGDRVRYVEEKEQWLVWGEHWWKTSKHGVYSKARATIRSLRDEAMAETDPVRRKLLFSHNRKSQSKQAFEQMLELVALELTVLAEDLDRGDLVAFSNGVFDPRTGSLRPGRREDLLTKHVAMPYDSANPECARCLKHKGANPKARTATIKSSKAWEERLDEWIAERCELGKGLSAGPSELLADFSSWHGEKVAAQKLGRLLSKKEGIERDKSGGRFYNGIRLRKKRKK